MLSSADLEELRRVRSSLASLRFEAELLRLYLLARKYNPNQPRIPAGQPGGGQWTSGGTSSHASDSNNGQSADEVDSNSGHSTDADAQALLQPAYAVPPLITPAIRGAQMAYRAGLAFYNWMSARNSGDGTAVIAFRAEDFRPGGEGEPALVSVARLDREEVRAACPRLEEVQGITDNATNSLNRNAYASAAAYGTAVHTRIRDEVNGMKDNDLRAEVSLLKTLHETRDAHYGERGSVRIDVLENTRTGTVCVYDIKTGDSGLTPARMAELASTVYLRYPATWRIIVTETRPRR